MTSNAYPEKPTLPYVHTSVAMPDVIAHLQSAHRAAEVSRAAYIMFRLESGNGAHGINNNYVGCQADGGRWPAKWDAAIVGAVAMPENGTGLARIFVAFDSWASSVEFLLDRVETRGLYIGGKTWHVWPHFIATESDLCRAYHKEWVTGSAAAEPSMQQVADFVSMYGQAAALFRGALAVAPVDTKQHIEATTEVKT